MTWVCRPDILDGGQRVSLLACNLANRRRRRKAALLCLIKRLGLLFSSYWLMKALGVSFRDPYPSDSELKLLDLEFLNSSACLLASSSLFSLLFSS